MTPIEDLLTSSQRLSFDGTEYRIFFPAGWREKIFLEGIKKRRSPPKFRRSAPCWCVARSLGGRCYNDMSGRVNLDGGNEILKYADGLGGCLLLLEHCGQLCARVGSDFGQVVFFRL